MLGDDDYATDYEVVEDSAASDDHQAGVQHRPIISPAPVHPLSSLVTIAIDLVWNMVEIAATMTVAGLLALWPLMLSCGSVCFVSVLLIQRHVDHDSWRAAIAKAGAMGVLAAVPYAVTGSVASGVLLSWAGIQKLEPMVRGYLPAGSE